MGELVATKSLVVRARLSVAEKARLERHARAAGVSVSELLRRSIPVDVEAATANKPFRPDFK